MMQSLYNRADSIKLPSVHVKEHDKLMPNHWARMSIVRILGLTMGSAAGDRTSIPLEEILDLIELEIQEDRRGRIRDGFTDF